MSYLIDFNVVARGTFNYCIFTTNKFMRIGRGGGGNQHGLYDDVWNHLNLNGPTFINTGLNVCNQSNCNNRMITDFGIDFNQDGPHVNCTPPIEVKFSDPVINGINCNGYNCNLSNPSGYWWNLNGYCADANRLWPGVNYVENLASLPCKPRFPDTYHLPREAIYMSCSPCGPSCCDGASYPANQGVCSNNSIARQQGAVELPGHGDQDLSITSPVHNMLSGKTSIAPGSYSISTIDGRTVLSGTINGTENFEINVERLLPGIYILNVNYQYKCKFVKM
ncbi:MAG: T9SS type A sorting domain-containing protein [Candidatus Pollutiaquabacter aromativorans]